MFSGTSCRRIILLTHEAENVLLLICPLFLSRVFPVAELALPIWRLEKDSFGFLLRQFQGIKSYLSKLSRGIKSYSSGPTNLKLFINQFIFIILNRQVCTGRLNKNLPWTLLSFCLHHGLHWTLMKIQYNQWKPSWELDTLFLRKSFPFFILLYFSLFFKTNVNFLNMWQ